MSEETPQTYAGFPNRVRSVPVPAPMLGSLLERIDDLAELKCALRAVALLNQKRERPRFVTLGEMQADANLARGVPTADGRTPADEIERALGKAVRRGTLAFAIVGAGASRQPIFGLNTAADRAALASVAGARPPATRADFQFPPPDADADRPNVFALYEQNIGMISPMIADELREAEGLYPEDWIADAIKEAVTNNKRNWRYVAAILDRWEREGKGHGESGRHPKKAARF